MQNNGGFILFDKVMQVSTLVSHKPVLVYLRKWQGVILLSRSLYLTLKFLKIGADQEN